MSVYITDVNSETKSRFFVKSKMDLNEDEQRATSVQEAAPNEEDRQGEDGDGAVDVEGAEGAARNVINRQNLRKAERELEGGGTVMAFLRRARHTFGNAIKKYFTKLLEAIENDAQLGGDIQEDEDEQEEAPVQVYELILINVSNSVGNTNEYYS